MYTYKLRMFGLNLQGPAYTFLLLLPFPLSRFFCIGLGAPGGHQNTCKLPPVELHLISGYCSYRTGTRHQYQATVSVDQVDIHEKVGKFASSGREHRLTNCLVADGR